VQVVVLGRGNDEEQIVAKVEAALRLIMRVDGRRYTVLSQYVQAVVCTRGVVALGQYLRAARVCLVDTDYIRRTIEPEQLAVVIVHEASHARLHRAGIRYGRNRESRIERICVREELRFARKIPDAKKLVEWITARLNSEN
jgi:hypothetical protein